jgi:uncharacterized membrane protein
LGGSNSSLASKVQENLIMKKSFSLPKIFKNDIFWLTVIMAGALVLHLWLMSFLRSLTFDEIVSCKIAELPFSQIWFYVQWEMHPPLHYYFLHFWLAIFGRSEFSAHFSSIFLSLLAIPVMYFLGREVFRRRLAGLAAAVLYAFSPLFCFYGVWARMYTMLFLTASLSFLFFLRFIRVRGRREIIEGILFSIFTLAALLSHLTAGIILAIEAVWLFYLVVRHKKKILPLARKFFFPVLAIVAVYGIWFWHFWQLRLSSLSGDAWYFNAAVSVFYPLLIMIFDCLKYFSPLSSYWPSLLSFSLLAIGGFFALFDASFDENNKLRVRMKMSEGVFFSGVIIIVAFAGLFTAKLFVLRYAIIPAVGFFLFIGYGFASASKPWRMFLMIIFLTLSIYSFWFIPQGELTNDDWRGVSNFISSNEQGGDKIVGSLYFCLLPLSVYYHGQLPAMAPLDEKYRGDDALLTAIRTNIYPTTTTENVGQLENFLGGARRVFLIVSDGGGAFINVPKISEDWLISHGYSVVEKWPDQGEDQSLVGVWLWEKR